MDLQGTPIGSSNQGMKNTTDPRAQIPNPESSGPVASDSLAAESVRSGGAYADNPNSAPSGVPGSKSTLNTTDTSAATALDPTPDAAAREAKSAWSEAADLKGPSGLKYAEGVGGQPKFQGSIGEGGYAGGPTGASGTDASGTSGEKSYTGASDATYGTTSGATGDNSGSGAYSYDGSSAGTGVSNQGFGKPKGKSLQEGGFEGEGQGTGGVDIGSDQDPGRAALQGLQSRNALPSGGTGPADKSLDNQGGYDALESDEQA